MHWPHKRLGQAALAVAAAVLMLLAMSSWVLLRSINQLGRSTSPAAAPTWFLPGARDAKPHPANFIDEICPSPGKWRNRSRHLHDANHDLEMVWVPTQGSASCNTEPRLPRTKALGSLVGMRARRPPLRILFVGDSTMVRLSQGFEDLCEGKMDVLAQEEGCGFLDFLARTESPRRAYHAVNRSLCCGKFDVDQLDTEDGGPRLCNSWGYGIGRRVRCTSTMLDLELVPITMCNDRLRQSALVAYRRPYTYDAMVVNCGLHGMPHKHGVGGHVADVRGYLDMTIHMARHVVWLTTSRTLNGVNPKTKLPWPQTNEIVSQYNIAIKRMIRERFKTNISILDAEKFSKREDMHADNVHMIPAYYQQLAVILDNFFLAKVMN